MKKKIIAIILAIIVMLFIFKPHGINPTTTWGVSWVLNGFQYKYTTLNALDRFFVFFPNLDYDNVYYVPDGKSYHSVPWCYTLSRSTTILHESLADALIDHLEPCSKCVE